jgi:Type II secretion system (T2SS), protein N
MPASASRRRTPDTAPQAPPRRRRFALVSAVASLALIAVVIAFLPASLIARFVPADVRLGETAGTLWHGTATDLLVRGHRAGAVEWTLKPWPLMTGQADLGLRWVMGGALMEAQANLAAHRAKIAALQGRGSLADVAELGIAPNWTGQWDIALDELGADYARDPWRVTAIVAARGALRVRNLAVKSSGTRLGDYELEFPAGAAAGTVLSGTLRDLGGALEVQGTLRLDFAQRQLLVNAYARERPGAPPEVMRELQSAAQLSGRDSTGRIPIDLEISF